MKENNLPKSFGIKWSEDPKWKKFIKWFNDNHSNYLDGIHKDCYYGVTTLGTPDYFAGASNFENILTLDEFFEILGLDTTYIVVQKSQLKKIYDVACGDWKVKIEKYAQRNPFDDKCSLLFEEVDEMFNAATTSQKPLLESIFGTRDKSVNVKEWTLCETFDGFVDSKNMYQLAIRSLGELKNKGFFLSSFYNWKIVKDEFNELVLVPTKK